MGIFKRFSQVLQSELNALLDKAENPEKLRNQAILDLQELRKKAQALLVTSIGALKVAEKDARDFLSQHSKSNNINNLASEIKSRLDEEKKAIDKVKRGIDIIDEKIAALKTSPKQDLESHENKSLDSFDTFARMEEKIDRKERELEALNELLALDEEKNKSNTSKESSKGPPDLMAELDALKKKLKDDSH
jgi:phage shock protein A